MRMRLNSGARPVVCLGPALVMLAGCSFVPDYKRPAVNMPAQYAAPQIPIAAAAWPRLEWWQEFKDPELNRLEDLARAHNDDILSAIAAVKAADGQAEEAGSALLPGVSLSGSQDWRRSTTQGQLSSLGLGGLTSGSSSGSTTSDSRNYGLTGSISYEIDFWGVNRATAKQADYQLLSSRYSQANVALTVTTSVATAYFQAVAYAETLAVAQKNLDLARQTLDVYQARLEVGTATALDVAQQQATVAQEEETIPGDENNLQQELNALGILVGQTPEELKIQLGSLVNTRIPQVAAGLPSELLKRRPDVAEAEATLLAQNQAIGIARGDFFPSISLTGSGGFQSQALNKLLIPGASSLSLGTSISQTLFDNGKLLGQLKAAHGQYEEDAAAYHKAVLQALTDVEDALDGVKYVAEQEKLQEVAYQTSYRANDIAMEQMKAGTVDITTVLNTEDTLRTAELNVVNERLAQINSLITLYKALGGGWSSSDVAAAKG